MTTDLEDIPMRCAHWDGCSAQICALDPFIAKRHREPGDPRCDMPKATRHHYWLAMTKEEQAALPLQGYFEAEITRMKQGKARWEALTQEEKDRQLRKLAELRQGAQHDRTNPSEASHNALNDYQVPQPRQNEQYDTAVNGVSRPGQALEGKN